MGSAAPARTKHDTPLPSVPEPVEPVAQVMETKTEAPLQEIEQTINREYCSLKSSQSTNLQKPKNEAKIKKVKDIRSFQNLKGLYVLNDQNQVPILQLNQGQIEDVSILRKSKKQLNPLTRKKMASDRIMLSHQSKTQNVISSNYLNSVQSRNLDSRARRCRVSKML